MSCESHQQGINTLIEQGIPNSEDNLVAKQLQIYLPRECPTKPKPRSHTASILQSLMHPKEMDREINARIQALIDDAVDLMEKYGILKTEEPALDPDDFQPLLGY